jgi:hypothetical protein
MWDDYRIHVSGGKVSKSRFSMIPFLSGFTGVG